MKPSALALLTLALAGCTGPDTHVNKLYPIMVTTWPGQPAGLDLGGVVIGTVGDGPITISNSGRVSMDVSFAFTGPDADKFSVDQVSPLTIEAAQNDLPTTTMVNVEITPSTYVEYDATLAITTQDTEQPTEVDIPVTAMGKHAPQCDLAIDPLSVDFGDVDPGDLKLANVMLQNTGDDDCTLGAIDQLGSGQFELEFDPSNQTLASGASTPIEIAYQPVLTTGDNGSIAINSNDPDTPQTVVTLLGNGGGDYSYPVAVIDCPDSSEPPTWAILDGAGSYDPSGDSLTYTWSLSDKPEGSGGYVQDPANVHTQVWTDIAGNYEVELVVTNTIGVKSAPARCPIKATPSDALHIELVWDGPTADVDLHLTRSDSVIWEKPGDVNWCNKTPDWGTAGPNDADPRLDLDDTSGYGPENINIKSPENGIYYIEVMYFKQNSDKTINATVRTYVHGALVSTLKRAMVFNDVWTVGQVNWPDGTVGEDTDASAAATLWACY